MSGVWEVVVEFADRSRLPVFEAALEELADAVAAFVDESAETWRVTGYFCAEPEFAEVERALSAAGRAQSVSFRRTGEVDWVAAYGESSPPFLIDRYYIAGSHVSEEPPRGLVAIRIDAGLAFGTGRHETTEGCLRAFERLPGAAPARAADIGTGSGILAIALAKRFGARVVAGDIDSVAVEVARRNVALNGVADRVSVVEGRGFGGEIARRDPPCDLIVANIVEEALADMAAEIEAALADDGRVVLSGLFGDQADAIAAAYEARRFEVADRVAVGSWTTLCLVRR